ncbi:MAG: response regulator [Thermoanaerobacteraceae bacterium]|nr:response regulator [Thermoanaerobacteraceae bacterium]
MLRLFIVDDEPLERQAIRYLLAKARPQYQVVAEGRDGGEAVALGREVRPDVILLDIKMPVMDGLAAGRALRRLLPEVRMVFLTAYDEFAYAQEAVALGASRYLLKPVAGEDLISVLDSLAQEIEEERRIQEEAQKWRAALEEMLPLIRLGFVLDLVSGHIAGEEVKARAEFLGLPSLPRLAIVIAIDNFPARPAPVKEAERQFLKKRVLQVIEERVSPWPGALAVPGFKDEFLLLLPFKELDGPPRLRDAVTRLGEEICAGVRELTPVTVTVGIGRPVDDPALLATSYAEAAVAVEYRLLYGGDQVIHADDVAVLPRSSRVMASPCGKELALAVRLGDREKARRCLAQIIAETVVGKEGRPPVFKVRFLELLSVAAQAALEAGADPEDIAGMVLQGSQEILTLESLAEAENKIGSQLQTLVEKVVGARERRNSNLIEKAVAYIKQSYHRDLSLEEVARHVFLSPCYFSRLFKQVRSENFNDYLTRMRMEEAKKLLLTTDYSVNEIASRVGYRDARYFGQVFKKQEGCTPTAFRKTGGNHHEAELDG